MSTNNSDLRAKIDEAKRLLPLPQLLERLGLGAHAKKSALCPLHDDKHPSFSVFQGKGGLWHYKCFAGCSEGDEIMFLRKLKGLSMTDAMSLFLEMAGFPHSRPPKSHEYPKSPGFPESLKSPVYPVSPVSNGQGSDKELEKELKKLATRYACTQSNNHPGRRLFEIARGARAIEKKTRRKLTTDELMVAFNQWYSLSGSWLDPKMRDDHLASFLAGLGKVRLPMGEGDTIKKALEAVSKLSVSELPIIPGMPDAPESWRRVAALHREMSRRCASKTYFLSCRDTAKAFAGLSHQAACNINLALARLGVIKIVSKGDTGPSGKASTFRCLLPQTDNVAPQAC
jgi:CHC2-type zinc finger protein